MGPKSTICWSPAPETSSGEDVEMRDIIRNMSSELRYDQRRKLYASHLEGIYYKYSKDLQVRLARISRDSNHFFSQVQPVDQNLSPSDTVRQVAMLTLKVGSTGLYAVGASTPAARFASSDEPDPTIFSQS